MIIIALLLASVVFLSVTLVVGALMLRGQWDKMGAGMADDGTRSGSRGSSAATRQP
jgi:hypothetical protein